MQQPHPFFTLPSSSAAKFCACILVEAGVVADRVAEAGGPELVPIFGLPSLIGGLVTFGIVLYPPVILPLVPGRPLLLLLRTVPNGLSGQALESCVFSSCFSFGGEELDNGTGDDALASSSFVWTASGENSLS